MKIVSFLNLEGLPFQVELVDITVVWPYFPIGGLIALIFYMISHPEKVERWSSIIFRFFSYFSKRAERRSVSSDIQSRISSYVKNFNLTEALPYGIKFEWVTGENFDSFVQKGEVVVIMDHHKNNAKNFLNALTAYIAKGFLPDIRAHVPPNFLHASELLLQEKIIEKERPDALEMFRNEVLPKKLNKEVKKIHEKLTELDKFGFFQYVYLPEIVFVGPRFRDYDKTICVNEIWGFLNLLDYIAHREPSDESGKLEYTGTIFHVWTILVAKAETIVWGTDPYTNRVNTAISKHFDSVYMMARGNNIGHVEDLIKATMKNTRANFRWKKIVKALNRTGKKTDVIISLFRI